MASEPAPSPERRDWKSWLSHAFAVEKAEDIDPNPHQREIVDRLCREVVRRRMTTPALLALEMSRPLNGLSAATMHTFQPIIAAVMTTASYEQFALFLEHRGSIDYLCKRIEYFQEHGSGTPEDAKEKVSSTETKRQRDEETK